MKEYIEPEVEVTEYCIMDIIAKSTPIYGSDTSVTTGNDDTFGGGGEGGNPGGNGGGFGGEGGGYSPGDGEDGWTVD